MTITYQEVKRQTKPWGIEVTVAFSEDGKVLRNTTFRFDSTDQITAELTSRCDQKVSKIELKKSALNYFDLGENSRDVLEKLIVAVRANPDLTVVQSTGWYDTNYPDALFNGVELLKRFRTHLTQELGFEPTWDQFKSYVINNKFMGVDEQ